MLIIPLQFKSFFILIHSQLVISLSNRYLEYISHTILFSVNKIAATHFFCNILFLPIESEIIDRFLYWRCLNDCINLPYMIRSFASGAISSLVAKKGTNMNILLLWIRLPLVDRFWCFRCLNDRIEVSFMMGWFRTIGR